MAEKYDTPADPPTRPAWDGYVETKNKAEVLRFLQGAGWVIAKQRFYDHCSEGKLKLNRAGVYSKRGVMKYARTWLVHEESGGLTTEEADEKLAELKTRREIERIELDIDKRRWELDIDRGKYLLRSDVEAELTARAVAFEAGLEYFFQSRLPEIIAMVGGEMGRSAELLDFLQAKKDELLNRYADLSDFEVLYQPEDTE